MPLPIIGRKIRVYRGDVATGTVFVGVTSKTITINNEAVDITDDDDNGWRSMLADPAVRSIDISAEGVLKDDGVIVDAINASSLLEEYTIDIEGVGSVSGDFYVNGLEITGATNDAARYSTTFQSSGPAVYTQTAS